MSHFSSENDPRSLRNQLSLGGPSSEDLAMAPKKKVRMSSPERFEIKQLIAAGVIDKSELPDFDEESGLLPKVDSDDEDVEVDLVEDEAPFLKGHGRMINDLSPVRYRNVKLYLPLLDVEKSSNKLYL